MPPHTNRDKQISGVRVSESIVVDWVDPVVVDGKVYQRGRPCGGPADFVLLILFRVLLTFPPELGNIRRIRRWTCVSYSSAFTQSNVFGRSHASLTQL